MENRLARLVYIASALLVLTTVSGLIWLRLLAALLEDAGAPIPFARSLSLVLVLLVLSAVAYMIRAARAELARATLETQRRG